MNAEARSFPGLRVLVVEDEAFISLHVEDMVRALSCEVIATASTVDAALASVRNGGIDCALLDLNLHGSSVLPVAEALAGFGLPFVLATGSPRRESDPALLLDARRVNKPFSLASLSAAIGDALSRK
jgi:DNA-binding response OmpR family regulator